MGEADRPRSTCGLPGGAVACDVAEDSDVYVATNRNLFRDDAEVVDPAVIADRDQLAIVERRLVTDLNAPGAGWRTFNARGVLADRMEDWGAADAAYRRGLKLDPSSPQLLNNFGRSLLLRGQWADAYREISKAAALAPDDKRIAANLDLATSALAADLPGRQGESSFAYAARLNDTGVLALRAGQNDKAQAAFARALELSEHWFTRAANNLSFAGRTASSSKR